MDDENPFGVSRHFDTLKIISRRFFNLTIGQYIVNTGRWIHEFHFEACQILRLRCDKFITVKVIAVGKKNIIFPGFR